MPAKNYQIIDWGLSDYRDAFTRQQELIAQRQAKEIPDTLITTEHKPVYTIGKRIGAAQHLLSSKDELKAECIEFVESNRGGDITYHGPGQLVAYSIISLAAQRDLHLYLRNLEQVIINTLGYLGLAAHRRKGLTGIWLEKRKVAAIGVAVKQWISYHGFAINVNNKLDAFDKIIPCGISPEEGSVTSLSKELRQHVDMVELKRLIGQEWVEVFNIH